MKPVELYARVRHACHVEGMSQREAARRLGIDPKTVAKVPTRPKLDAFTAIIDQILISDRSAPPKQRHTAKRIHDRLRAEHGFVGGYTTIKDYVYVLAIIRARARNRGAFSAHIMALGHF